MLTDFQKDCIQKVKDHWNLIPKTETGITRWQMMPTKVALIVDLFKQSKLSAEDFTKSLGLTKGLINKFVKGKLPDGKNWPELTAAFSPEKARKEQANSPEEIAKKEILVKKEILTILNRDKIKDIGLRDETIATELSSYPKRFVVTILNRLVKDGKLESFKSEDKKYKKYRMKKANDPQFRKEKKAEILKLLEETGLGKSRGLSPLEISISVGLENEALKRELLSELETENLIVSVGLTKGKKYVIASLKAEAKAIYESEQKLKELEYWRKQNIMYPDQTDSKSAIPGYGQGLPTIESKSEIRTEVSKTEITEKKFSLDSFLREKSKEDIINAVKSLPNTTFGELIEILKEKNASLLINAFYKLTLSDLDSHRVL